MESYCNFIYEHNSGTDANLRTFLGNKTSDPVVESSLENAYLNTQISPNSTNGLQINAIKIGMNRKEDNGGKFFIGYISATGIYDGALNTVGVKSLFNTNETCYHENTKVLTKDGYKNIKNLKRGDLIKTYHNDYQPLAKLIKSMNVTQQFILFPKNSISEGIPNEDFMITRGHPIYFTKMIIIYLKIL